MHITEKRKLEGLVVSKLRAARSAYSSRRHREHLALIEDVTNNPPQSVVRLAQKLAKAEKAHAAQADELQKKAAALGYNLSAHRSGTYELYLSYEYVDGRKTYIVPAPQEHFEQTEATLRQLDDLATAYTIKIWAESEDMGSILRTLTEDIRSMTA